MTTWLTTRPSPHDREDTALVERVRAGDDAAFGELYDRWFDRVYDLAIRITRDASTAGDVAQDAFLAAWRGLPQLEQPDAFGGWLLRIARNAALNRQRKEERSRAYDPESMAMIERTGLGVEDRIDTADDPSRAAEDAEIASLVWDAVDALGERDSEVLDLTLRHGLSPAKSPTSSARIATPPTRWCIGRATASRTRLPRACFGVAVSPNVVTSPTRSRRRTSRISGATPCESPMRTRPHASCVRRGERCASTRRSSSVRCRSSWRPSH